MANKKISELTSRTPSLTDLILVGDPSSGYSYKATVTALATIIETDIADAYVTLSTTQTISGAKTFSNNITATSVSNAASDPDKFLVLNGSNVINYRTGSQVLSDIGGADDSLVVHKAQDETITGIKKFTSRAKFDNSINLLQGGSASIDTGYSAITADSATFYLHKSGSIFASLNVVNLTSSRTYTLQDAAGTLAFTSDISGAVSGNTNYIPKFTSSNVIGNSVIYESSSNIGIGTTTPSAKLSVNGNAILSGSLNATETYLDSPNGLVFELNSSNANGGYADFKTNSTIIGRIGTATQVLGSGGTSIFAISSRGANAFVLGSNGTEGIRIANGGAVSIANIANATTDTDKFLVSDSGVVKYRTGAEVLSDIGGASSSSISGTTNYIPKFTSSSAIGNSAITDDGTTVTINSRTLRSNYIVNDASGSPSGQEAIRIINNNGYIGFFNGGNSARSAYIQGNTTDLTLSTSLSTPLIFGVNNSEQMRLTSTGLGIGTSSPTTTLTVNGTITSVMGNNSLLFNSASATTGYQYLTLSNSGAGFTLGIERSTGGALSNGSTAYATVIQTSNSTNLQFGTNNNIRATLDASGNLGLGVTPSAWLSTNRAFQIGYGAFRSFTTSANTYLDNNNYVNTSGTDIYLNNGAAGRYRIADEQHIWYQAASGTAGNAISFTQAMTLDASGNLGVGATSIGAQYKTLINVTATTPTSGSPANASTLAIAGGTTTVGNGPIIQLNNVSGAKETVWRLSAVTTSGNNGDLVFNGYAGGADFPERMRITSGGNVGIGTTSPTSIGGYTTLSINNATYGGIIETMYNGTPYGRFFTNSSNYVGLVSVANVPLILGTNDTERMRITSGGNLLVGASASDLTRVATFMGSSGIAVQYTGTTGTYLDIIPEAANGAVNIAADARSGAYPPMVFKTSATERMRIKASGVINISNIPTSSTGLSAGDIWNDSGTLKIV